MAVMVMSMALAALTNGTRPARADLPLVVPPGLEPFVPVPYVQPNGYTVVEWPVDNASGLRADAMGKIGVNWTWGYWHEVHGENVILVWDTPAGWKVSGHMIRGGSHWVLPPTAFIPGNTKYAGVKVNAQGQPVQNVDYYVNVGEVAPPN
jgi:hypothetical protein